MKLAYAFAGLAMLGATMASAQQTATDAGQDGQKEKKICHTEEVTGSYIQKRRVCMTKSEWAKSDAETQRDLERMRNHSIRADR